ncbi:conserved protein of unknown function [Burkholderia multivorans]
MSRQLRHRRRIEIIQGCNVTRAVDARISAGWMAPAFAPYPFGDHRHARLKTAGYGRMTAFGNFAARRPLKDGWCSGGDLNPHASRRYPLKIVRLPISPPEHEGRHCNGQMIFCEQFVSPASRPATA